MTAMRRRAILSIIPACLFIMLLLASCDDGVLGGFEAHEFEFDFREDDHGWEYFFSDYPADQEEGMNFQYAYTNLPEPLDTGQKGLFISAHNKSDDVKMLFRRQVEGLEPNTTYDASFQVEFATQEPSGCAGIGGPPGEAVRIIADASAVKPDRFLDDMGWYRLNIQHEASDTGVWYQDAIMGDIANSRACEEGREFELKEVTSEVGQKQVETDEQGRAWLMFGTRSGFEGQTDLYYTYFRAVLTE